nr:unnamed protein product [Callosobruchus analis]
MNLINFHLIQNDQYIQRGFLLFLNQWSSSLALNLIPRLSVAISELQLHLSDLIIKKILDPHSVLNKQSKSVVFLWCSGYMGISGNENADTAARINHLWQMNWEQSDSQLRIL